MCYKCGVINLSADFDGLEPELQRIAQLIYDGKLTPGQIDKAMVTKVAGELMAGVFKGFGKSFDSADLTPSERTFLGQINKNVFVFSGFKNYQQLKETSLLLKTDDGKIKPFNQFLNDVKTVNKTYNQTYLSAEYGNAIASAQTAQAWHDFKNNGVKMLEYQTAGDDRVRDDHRILNKIVLPITDPFWQTHYPPNDWGCRCEAVPTTARKKAGESAGKLPELPEMFKNNVGESGIIFPSSHPYYDVALKIKNSVLEQVDEIYKSEHSPNLTPKNFEQYEEKLDIKVDKVIFSYLSEETSFTNNAGGAYYDFANKVVNIPFDERRKNSKWYAEAVVYHEFGHAADYQRGLGKLDMVGTLMNDYRRKYKNHLADYSTKLKSKLVGFIKEKDYTGAEQTGAALDTIMSLNKKFGAGHGYKVMSGNKKMDYFDVPGFKEAEFIAHAFENRFAGNPVFAEVMPDLFEDMKKLVDDFK